MATFESPYALGERVYVGPGKGIVAVVIGVLWSTVEADIKVTYVHEGRIVQDWVNLAIVRKAEDE